MTARDTKTEVTEALRKLLSLPLSIARDVGNMKNFQFGAIRPHPAGKGTVGDYALHIQCPWRIAASDGIVTGFADYYEPVEIDGEVDQNNGRTGNLQRERLGGLLREFDAATKSWINSSSQFVVEEIAADEFGGFELKLSGGFRLQVFPGSSRNEDWRLFVPGDDSPHFVIEGGHVSVQ